MVLIQIAVCTNILLHVVEPGETMFRINRINTETIWSRIYNDLVKKTTSHAINENMSGGCFKLCRLSPKYMLLCWIESVANTCGRFTKYRHLNCWLIAWDFDSDIWLTSPLLVWKETIYRYTQNVASNNFLTWIVVYLKKKYATRKVKHSLINISYCLHI